MSRCKVATATVFQPTLPARGATLSGDGSAGQALISTHAPRTGSDKLDCQAFVEHCLNFNPRSPHGERLYVGSHSAAYSAFQPTLPARGATRIQAGGNVRERYFNPRSPHGERLRALRGVANNTVFQPTLPARGATTALKTGADPVIFQPTLPARGATMAISDAELRNDISTHAPRTGSDDIAVRSAFFIC